MTTVNELVEWATAKIWDSPHFSEKLCREVAKQILSHPDLALLLNPQYVDWEKEPEKRKLSQVSLVIPLAEAINREVKE